MTTATAAKPSTLSAEARATYFRTKLDAEWGPYDLNHALEANRNGIVILDTRTAEAFAEEHIAGAINIPENELTNRLNELSKDKEIVPYCWSVVCHLATRVSLVLSEKGYRVHELAGGIEYWKNYKLPVESKSNPYPRIYAVVQQIPKGRVATYGQVARLAGLSRHARQVGYALSNVPDGLRLPWHRVINSRGEISTRSEPYGANMQYVLLKKEGIRFEAHTRVSLRQFQWQK